jgi:hypothetical protein
MIRSLACPQPSVVIENQDYSMKQQVSTSIINFASIAFLVLFPHFVPLPFYSYTIVCLGIIYLIFKIRHYDFNFIGLKKDGINIKSISIGILSAIIWVAFNQWAYIPFIKYCFVVPDYTEYNFIRESIFKFGHCTKCRMFGWRALRRDCVPRIYPTYA